jgi:hypothetical protein
MEQKEIKSLKSEVFEALGAASMCWSETPKGIFDSSEALRIGNEVMGKIYTDLPNALKVLVKHLGGDKSADSYYFSWQANIAMSFKDEFERRMGDQDSCVGKHTLWIIANEAAKNFLDMLCLLHKEQEVQVSDTTKV